MMKADREVLIKKAFREALKESKAPGGVLYVGTSDSVHLHVASGYRQTFPKTRPAKKDTLYDLASVTKVVGTATAIMQLKEQQKLSLDQPVTDFVPLPELSQITLKHLLTHTSGLVAVERYFTSMTSLDAMLQRYAKEGIESLPDVEHLYSDVGYMLLGRVVEEASRESLEVYCQKNIFAPLEMNRTSYNPPKSWVANCAPTENDPWRGKLVHGEVHDENTWAVGGISGHAGIFSNAPDLAKFCRGLMTGKILKLDTLREMTTMNQKPLYPWQGIGWQIDPWSTKKTGFLPSRAAFGHTGWTGTSIWMDVDTDLFVILLSNTCHPDREDRDNETLRRTVHTAIGKTFYTHTNTHSGLDRLVRENFKIIEDRRFALLTNHAAVDQHSRHILDVLGFVPDLQLKRLYSPEHGIRGQAEAGEKIEGQDSAVPVTSLYGKQKAPAPHELAEIDVFLIDLQDIGARYYTYMATMKACLEACAEADVPVVVLDRPNPVNGITLEGPIAENTNSLVSSTAIPIRHGMTMGELAVWFQENDLKRANLKLEINYLDNWQPKRMFDECTLPWIAPSPNMPDPDTALLYIGTCLIEGTNLNEGRGTETPFKILGAPWLDAQAVLKNISQKDHMGCRLEGQKYTPTSIPGKATNPKYNDEECNGIRIHVEDPKKVSAFQLAVAILSAIQKTHSDKLEFIPFFDTLAGGPDVRERILDGQSASRMIKAYKPGLERFNQQRPHLYNEEGIPYSFLEED
jgi:uncharacterized protein YbbC (DUF1343 family)/CubicO group peptidase (beta-lactamase class C family)